MMGFLIRWAFAFGLLAATFNPTEWNYVRWSLENYTTELPMTVQPGLLLVIGYILYLRATPCLDSSMSAKATRRMHLV